MDEVDEKSREPDFRDSYVQEDARVNFGRFGELVMPLDMPLSIPRVNENRIYRIGFTLNTKEKNKDQELDH